MPTWSGVQTVKNGGRDFHLKQLIIPAAYPWLRTILAGHTKGRVSVPMCVQPASGKVREVQALVLWRCASHVFLMDTEHDTAYSAWKRILGVGWCGVLDGFTRT